MRAILFGAALVLAACASDDPNPNPPDPTDPGPDDPAPPDQEARDYDDVAVSIGAAVYGGELMSMVDAVTLATGGIPAGFTQTSAMDVSGTRDGVSIAYNYYCVDDNDVPIASCGTFANHMHMHFTMSGALSSPMALDAVDQTGKWTVRDIEVGKPRVGGDSAMTYVTHIDGISTYDLAYDATLDHVRFAPGAVLPYEGTITSTVAVHRTRDGAGERNFAVTATIVFSSGTTATITLDSTINYSLDLTTGAVVKL
ncbi:MAG TPA: hypothetical protein VFQ53_32630 [Kofleriaceae bacterium]|nr:hypothetical protein [Kofleriaceae bacterium]